MQNLLNPIIYPITPIMPIYAYNITGSTFNIALIVLSALAVIGTSVLIGWVLSKVMASKGMVSKPIFNLIASGAIGLCLFLRFGLYPECRCVHADRGSQGTARRGIVYRPVQPFCQRTDAARQAL